MESNLTKDDLIQAFVAVNSGSKPVTESANNPLLWIKVVAFAVSIIFSLAGTIYVLDQGSQDQHISENKIASELAIKEAHVRAKENDQLLYELKLNQGLLIQNQERLIKSDEKKQEVLNGVQSSLVTKDELRDVLEAALKPLYKQLELHTQELKRRAEFMKDIAVFKESMEKEKK